MERLNWDEYFLNIALEVAKRATCLRRCFGAVIVKDNIIIGTGYNGAPRGEANCIDLGYCEREKQNVPAGERYELCRSVHGEMNAVINSDPDRMIGAKIYVAGFDSKTGEIVNSAPCLLCNRVIKNAQISIIIYRKENDIYHVEDVK